MDDLLARCAHDGCGQRRGRLSVFCDEHHRENLIRVGLVSEKPDDVGTELSGKCQRILKAADAGAITEDEMYGAMFDAFIHSGTHGRSEYWQPSFDLLSHETISGLFIYARRHPEPRIFLPRPTSEPAKSTEERRTLAVQAHLVDCLETLLTKDGC